MDEQDLIIITQVVGFHRHTIFNSLYKVEIAHSIHSLVEGELESFVATLPVSVAQLNLFQNFITKQSQFTAISDILKSKGNHLLVLNLSDMPGSSCASGINTVIRSLADPMCCLTSLDISRNCLSQSSVSLLKSVLPSCWNLVTLKLSECNNSLIFLFDVVHQLTSLETFDISLNQLSFYSFQKFTKACSSSKSLRNIKARKIRTFVEEDIRAITSLLRKADLHHLDISMNGIKDHMLKILTPGLKSSNLENLDLCVHALPRNNNYIAWSFWFVQPR